MHQGVLKKAFLKHLPVVGTHYHCEVELAEPYRNESRLDVLVPANQINREVLAECLHQQIHISFNEIRSKGIEYLEAETIQLISYDA